MKQGAARVDAGMRMFRAARRAWVGAAMFGLAACGMSGPPAAEYVLGGTPAVTPATVPQTSLPVVEVKRVQVPDYLDTTDILRRSGNQLVPSLTGRWGERLSVGMTRAMTASLAARLPSVVVTATPVGRPAREILVDVAAFEARADQVVLVADWTIVDSASNRTLVAEQTSLVEAIAGSGDAALVATMSNEVEQLAGQIAAGIKHDLRPD